MEAHGAVDRASLVGVGCRRGQNHIDDGFQLRAQEHFQRRFVRSFHDPLAVSERFLSVTAGRGGGPFVVSTPQAPTGEQVWSFAVRPYALSEYSRTMRSVLKKEPFSAIALRMITRKA